ncbi:DUF1317 family protein [Winslowiella arboricola]|uniref:DUF1317 family protein n=1 Tax=Winslowiella arboricola TaxID=2978220 RepID=UPI00225DD5DB|nr:DUF1317 family protein [Winslowiella arboricola]MCU5775195.1 DUF1317 domain-containing protein [Winslowiella arboricola]
MQKPDDPITVGRITMPFSHRQGGWLTPQGHVIKNPIKAQRIADQLNSSIVIH